MYVMYDDFVCRMVFDVLKIFNERFFVYGHLESVFFFSIYSNLLCMYGM